MNYEKTINEKVYQMSASVSENAKTLLLGMEQSKAKKLSVFQMQDLFTQIEQGIQRGECSEVEREPQEVRPKFERNIQEVETLSSFLESGDDTGGVCGVVSIPTEDMLILWNRRIDFESSTRRIQQQDKENDNRPNRLYKALQSSEHYPLLFAVQPYQGKLFYSIGDGRDWVNVYQTKVEKICKENNLSSILEEQVDQKYFLSSEATEKLLNNSITQPTRMTEFTEQMESVQHLTQHKVETDSLS